MSEINIGSSEESKTVVDPRGALTSDANLQGSPSAGHSSSNKRLYFGIAAVVVVLVLIIAVPTGIVKSQNHSSSEASAQNQDTAATSSPSPVPVLVGDSETPLGSIDYTGAVEYYDGTGADPACGVGCGWTELHDNGWTSGGDSIAVDWYPGTCGNGKTGNGICPQYGLCCSSFGWCGTTQAYCGSEKAPVPTPSIVYGLDNGSIQYFDGKNWNQLQGTGWNSAAQTLRAQFNPQKDGSIQVLIVVGLADGSIQYYNGNRWSQMQGTGWNSAVVALAVQWPSENTYNAGLRIVVGLQDSATEYYDGSGWRQLHNTGWDAETTVMSVFFDNKDYWPAVVQGLSNGAVVYHDTSGSWHSLIGSGWSNAVSKMQVQFPEENSQGYVKVVVGLDDGAVEYYDGTGWMELYNTGRGSSTNGLCAAFPSGNNNVKNIQVVQGLGDGAIEYFSNNAWSELLASGTEGSPSGVANMECSFANNRLEIVATYTNAPVIYYDSVIGTFTSLAGDGWGNQMSAFSADFSAPGKPRVVGGLQPMPKQNGIVAWLECTICTKAVGSLFGDSEEVCDAQCVTEVEVAGGGPEDPVADFVAAVCVYICNKIAEKVQGATEQFICTEVKMCKD